MSPGPRRSLLSRLVRFSPLSVACAIVVAGLAPLTLGGYLTYRSSSDALREENQAHLVSTAEQTSAQIEHLLFERRGDVALFSQSVAATAMSRPLLLRGMRSAIRDFAPLYQELVVTDTRGRVVEAVDGAGRDERGRSRLFGSSVRTSAWFARALASTGPQIVFVSPSPAAAPQLSRSRHPFIALYSPIRRGARLLGLFVDVVSWQAIESNLSQAALHSADASLHVFVLDETRAVLASDLPVGAFRRDFAIDGTTALDVADALAGKAVTIRTDSLLTGDARGYDLLAAAHSNATGWTTIAILDRGVAYAGIRPLRREALLIVCAASILVLLAALLAWLGLSRTVAEREQAEEQLRHAGRLEAVGRLAAGLAHDLNNLLTVIGGNAQAGLRQSGDPRARLTEVLAASERAADLIRKLLAFSRADSPSPTPLDLNDELAGFAAVVPRLVESNIVVETIPAPEPAPVLFDAVQLEQVLMNLAVNARDAMPDGGRLVVRVTNAENVVRLEISDTGTGMPEETVARIFDPFFTTKPRGVGSGLGLSMVWALVDRAGGTISVDSEEGRGTTFTIDLPRCPYVPAPRADIEIAPPSAARSGNVLLVDDDELVRAITSEMIRDAGLDVTEAADGAEALALLTRDRFDAIVCDVMMPRVTGLQLVDRLRRRGDLTPVILVSGYRPTEDAPGGDGLPLVEHVGKPFAAETLVAAVDRALEARLRASAA